jgi:hypothetical protein
LQAKWVPQRAVEEQFKQTNPFVSSLQHLWGYSLFAVGTGLLLIFLVPDALLFMAMLITIFLLPFYTGFTSLTNTLTSSRYVCIANYFVAFIYSGNRM